MASNPSSIRGQMLPTSRRLILERHLREHLPKLTGDVLVVGAGHNPYGRWVTGARGSTITDIESLPGVDLIADCHALPFVDARFDAVVSIEVFEHLKSPHVAAAEVHRVLRPGGKVLMSTPFLFHVHADPMDFNRFTMQGIKELLCAFSAVEIIPQGGRIHVLSDILSTAAKPMAAMRFVNHVLARGPLGRLSSKDCPTGYLAVGTK